MTRFNWFKAVGFGIIIWAIMFGLGAIAVGTGIFASVWTQLAMAVIAALVTYGFAVATRTGDAGHALGYGAVFAAVGIILDLAISQQLVSGLFALWTYYLTYAVILFTPTVQLTFSDQTSTHAV